MSALDKVLYGGLLALLLVIMLVTWNGWILGALILLAGIIWRRMDATSGRTQRQ